ncbi:hypothetical protein L227DRAFT_153911 [Lentinus tigrinus ALCF2SS1-6]|uniref:Uncharacterized protein n=1 Tax=Lentinus tigrinus ALCF2SS1-6 TaxID=1328759 RepID=A0A5C2S8L5_9APHY|nr:hypothetical protein L227DRAFT_153911 [Lentinus tigrinus ALCF2SS1-6]
MESASSHSVPSGLHRVTNVFAGLLALRIARPQLGQSSSPCTVTRHATRRRPNIRRPRQTSHATVHSESGLPMLRCVRASVPVSLCVCADDSAPAAPLYRYRELLVFARPWPAFGAFPPSRSHRIRACQRVPGPSVATDRTLARQDPRQSAPSLLAPRAPNPSIQCVT